jgi:hypothetical protein
MWMALFMFFMFPFFSCYMTAFVALRFWLLGSFSLADPTALFVEVFTMWALALYCADHTKRGWMTFKAWVYGLIRRAVAAVASFLFRWTVKLACMLAAGTKALLVGTVVSFVQSVIGFSWLLNRTLYGVLLAIEKAMVCTVFAVIGASSLVNAVLCFVLALIVDGACDLSCNLCDNHVVAAWACLGLCR